MPATIREYLEQDLAERIRSGLAGRNDLTLKALAANYGVSFTPIRQALRSLAAAGLVAKGTNGRLDVEVRSSRRRGRAASSSSPSIIPSASAELERVLREELIRASLRRDSAYLREEATAKRLGVGRTAIRQVFGRLAGQGLLVHVPRCGWKVRSFDAADLAAYIEIRELMEVKALELARPNVSTADLKRMLEGNATDRLATGIDNQIHAYLVEKAGNLYIRDFFERNSAYYTTLFDYAAPETKVVREMARQHRALLRAMIANDWEKARAALVDHIRAQRPVVEDLMRRVASSQLDLTQSESA